MGTSSTMSNTEITRLFWASQGLSAVGTALDYAGGMMQADIIREQARWNEKFQRLQARSAIRRGEFEAEQLQKETARLLGRQRATYAAQGVSADTGTPLEVQAMTAEEAAADVGMIRANAWREAFGHKMEAVGYKYGGRLEALAKRAEAGRTLMTGGIQFARDYADYRRWLERPSKVPIAPRANIPMAPRARG